MILNYDDLIRNIETAFSLHYEDYTINGGSLDDIQKTSEKNYDLERENGNLRIYGDNVFAVLEEDFDEDEVKGTVRKNLRGIVDDELTYRDRGLLDFPMRF